MTMIDSYRLLAHFWLSEPTAADLSTLTTLPPFAELFSAQAALNVTDLAVEYQRLFGFELPPYESLFLDPSAMLMAPAAQRIQTMYQQGRWTPPARYRVGGPDHVGLELLALADWLQSGQTDLARHLHVRHMALWIPVFMVTVRRLRPHPFYATLADLTLGLVLMNLPHHPAVKSDDLFPDLPPPTVYHGTDELVTAGDDDSEVVSLRQLIKRLLPPRDVGFYLTKHDIALIGQRLNLPDMSGERFRMLDTLFHLAGQYDLVPRLFEELTQFGHDIRQSYHDLTTMYPAWQPYNIAWQARLSATQTALTEWHRLSKNSQSTV